MAGLSTSGTLTHWLHDQFARDLRSDGAFGVLAAEAAKSPAGAKGVIVLPYFSGERTPIHDPHAKGVIFGLNLTHDRGDIYRAALEGIAFATNHIFETYRSIGAPPKTLLAVGGGTRNPVWLQATSDISGLPQTVRSVVQGASYGDAFLAALGVGAVGPNDIRSWNRTAKRVIPSKANKAVYERQYGIFKELYRRNRDLMEASG